MGILKGDIMKKAECISSLVNIMKEAINSGDWVVDGACDPEIYIKMAEASINKSNYESKHETWQRFYNQWRKVFSESEAIKYANEQYKEYVNASLELRCL